MTFDREPDLDNANVGTPDTIRNHKVYEGSYQIGNFLFCDLGGHLYGENQWRRMEYCG